jgi:hypothetical protein
MYLAIEKGNSIKFLAASRADLRMARGSRAICPWRAAALLYHPSPVEHEFTCPYCGEEISMVLDLSVGRQTYVEDCEVCCKPIEISFTVEDDDLASFYAKTLG